MFQSIGIDTVAFEVPYLDADLNNLRVICRASPKIKVFRFTDAIWIRVLPKQLLLLQCNLPRLLAKHNIRLSESPKEVAEALRRVKQATGFEVANARIRSIDITACFATDFDFGIGLRGFRKKIRGYDYNPEYATGHYWNSVDKHKLETGLSVKRPSRFALLVYDKKEEYCHSTGRKKLPEEILVDKDQHLLRIEMKLKRLTVRQLSRAGVWLSPHLTGRDLATANGFGSMIRFFEKRLPLFLRLSPQRKATVKRQITSRTNLYEHLLIDRLCSNSYEETLNALKEAGLIGDSLHIKEIERSAKHRDEMIADAILLDFPKKTDSEFRHWSWLKLSWLRTVPATDS